MELTKEQWDQLAPYVVSEKDSVMEVVNSTLTSNEVDSETTHMVMKKLIKKNLINPMFWRILLQIAGVEYSEDKHRIDDAGGKTSADSGEPKKAKKKRRVKKKKRKLGNKKRKKLRSKVRVVTSEGFRLSLRPMKEDAVVEEANTLEEFFPGDNSDITPFLLELQSAGKITLEQFEEIAAKHPVKDKEDLFDQMWWFSSSSYIEFGWYLDVQRDDENDVITVELKDMRK